MANNKDGIFLSAIKAEWGTKYGKANMVTLVLLIFSAITYFASDTAKQLIFVTSSTIKSCYLNIDLNQPYHETSYILLMSPALALAVFCLGYIARHEHKKDEISKKQTLLGRNEVCLFCGETSDIIDHKGKKVCTTCIKEMSQ